MCNLKIGLVLAGGIAKGAYQVGFLKAVGEYFHESEIISISAASIGVLNAYAFATKNLDFAEKIWRDISEMQNGKSILRFIKNRGLENVIDELTQKEIQFGEQACCQNLYATIFDVDEKKLHYVNLCKTAKGGTSQINKYLKASVAVIFLCEPIKINGHKNFDGAFVDNIPVEILTKEKLDYIICCYFDEANYLFENNDFDSKTVKIIFSDESRTKSSIFIESEETSEMIKTGYEKTKQIFADIFGSDFAGTLDKNEIARKIKMHNEKLGNAQKRVTGDFVISKINKALKKYRE